MARPTLATRMAFVLFAAIGAGTLGCAHGFNSLDPAADDQNPLQGGGGSDGAGGSTASSTSSTSSGTTTGSDSGTTTATSSTTTSSTSTTTTSSGSGGGSCDGSGSCDSCGNCAINSQCLPQMDGCVNDAECSGLIQCLSSCQDDVCANACAEARPAGMQLYMALITCVLCDACLSDCQGGSSGACQ